MFLVFKYDFIVINNFSTSIK